MLFPLFWLVTGLIVWGLLTIGAGIAVLPLWFERGPGTALAVLVLCVLSTAGWVSTLVTIEDPAPPDGCYRVVRSGELVTLDAGNGVLVPVNGGSPAFVPISCT